MKWRQIVACAAGLGVACLGSIAGVPAAELTLVPELSVRTEWNDNVDMSTSQKRGDFIATLTPAFSIGAATERLALSSRIGLGVLRYARDEERNTELVQFSANTDYRGHERLQVSASASLTEDEALQTELEETGLIVTGVNRRRWGGEGGLLYELTPGSTLGMDVIHQDTQYSGGGYVDYTQDSLGLTYRQTLPDEVNEVLVRPFYVHYDSDRSKVDNYGISAGWSRTWSHMLSSYVMLGVRHTTTEYKVLQQSLVFDPALLPRYPFRQEVSEVNLKESNWGGLGDLSITRRGESHSMSTGYKRDLDFSAEGEPVTTDRLYWTVSYSHTERLGAGFSTAVSHSKSAGDRTRTDDWYLDLAPSVSWRITEDHVLSGGYSYSLSLDKAYGEDREADRHRVWLSVTTRFPSKW
ncbi:MAG: outer membrane beta-barrel protein [Deltaproteobacteria bacterium]|nr:outer membrane beta-barrel protein [Deltaproteobacteria bacterium]